MGEKYGKSARSKKKSLIMGEQKLISIREKIIIVVEKKD